MPYVKCRWYRVCDYCVVHIIHKIYKTLLASLTAIHLNAHTQSVQDPDEVVVSISKYDGPHPSLSIKYFTICRCPS